MHTPDGFETLAIHAGQEPDPATGAVVPPIYQVSTYKQDGVGGLRGKELGEAARWIEGYEYSRTDNPTRGALEECLAALEGGARSLVFASGMAATDCLLRTVCHPGDHVLIPADAYGGTFRLFDKVLTGWNVSYQPVSMADPAAVRAALAQRQAKLIWVETPTNPLLAIADIATLARLARDAGALLVVDNTFASPYLQQPLALGADAVVHSTTKYVGGHSDVVGGAIVVADTALGESLYFLRNAIGSAPGPFDAWLTLRGAKTLAVRMDRHCAERGAHRRHAVQPPGGQRGVLPRTPGASGPRGGGEADAGLRRDGVIPGSRRPGGGRGDLRAHAPVHSRRVARRRRVAD